MIRSCLGVALSLSLSQVAEAAPLSLSPDREQPPVVLFVDDDDDDDDGRPDSTQARSNPAIRKSLLELKLSRPARVTVEGSAVRVFAGDDVASGPASRVWLQGMAPGTATLNISGHPPLHVSVLQVSAHDADGKGVSLASSHASISRSLPSSLLRPGAPRDDAELSFVVFGPEPAMINRVQITSEDASGRQMDRMGDVRLVLAPCPASVAVAPNTVCRTTQALRATGDVIDRSHPASAARSVQADVGGHLVLTHDGRRVARMRVGGPRQSALGPIERYRGRLRVRLVRQAPGASPPLGGSDASALRLIREEVQAASGLWGQCGIHFGAESELDVKVVDPPPSYLIALGGSAGLPAAGGEIAFEVDGQRLTLGTRPGELPTRVAARLAQLLEAKGFSAVVNVNPRIQQGALQSADVSVRRRGGGFAVLSSDGPVSTDPALDAELGEVDLSDGLTHFSDFNAAAGTLEERTLIRAFADGDPGTIEVLMIPSFARTGRIGESFIFGDGGTIQNVVIVDRAALVAGARSHALAHELGHILLDMPGHPDDYGVDSPSSLMDADAADPTIFGPRRLSLGECERALRQSGPGAPVPLLTPWPMIRQPGR